MYLDVPAIVSEETWNRCQALLHERWLLMRPKGRPSRHLFTGAVICTTCSERLYVPNSMISFHCRSCGLRVQAPALESCFIERLTAFLASEPSLQGEQEKGISQVAFLEEQLHTLQAKQQTIATEQELLYRLYIDRHIEGVEFKIRNTPLTVQAADLSAQLAEVESALRYLQEALDQVPQRLAFARHKVTEWPTLDLAAKHSIVRGIVDAIELGPAETSIVVNLQRETQTLLKLSNKRERIGAAGSWSSRPTCSAKAAAGAISAPGCWARWPWSELTAEGRGATLKKAIST